MSQRIFSGLGILAMLTGVVVLAPACFESNPQPSPGHKDDAVMSLDEGLPYPPEEKRTELALMALSAPGPEGEVAGVGRPGAATGASQGRVEDSSGVDQSVAFKVTADGRFAFVTSSEAKRTLKLVFGYEDGTSKEVEIQVPERDSEDGLAPWLLDADSGFSDPTTDSPAGEQGDWYNGGAAGGPVITITLEGGNLVRIVGAPFATTPLSMVSIMNVGSEASVVEQADGSGGFEATLPAEAGDQIVLFVYNPESPEKATSPFFATVSE